MWCLLRPCTNQTAVQTSNITSPLYVQMTTMSSPKPGLPSKKDHEQFIRPKRRYKSRVTRTHNKSHQQPVSTGATIEDQTKMSDFINPESVEKISQDQKLAIIITSLNKLHNKFDNIHTDLYKEKDGMWARLEGAEDQIESTCENTDNLKFELVIMKGIVDRQQKQIEHLTAKVDDLTLRQMSSNITISGLLPAVTEAEQWADDDEDPEQTEPIVTDKTVLSWSTIFFEMKLKWI